MIKVFVKIVRSISFLLRTVEAAKLSQYAQIITISSTLADTVKAVRDILILKKIRNLAKLSIAWLIQD